MQSVDVPSAALALESPRMLKTPWRRRIRGAVRKGTHITIQKLQPAAVVHNRLNRAADWSIHSSRREEEERRPSLSRYLLQVAALVGVWFAASIAIAFLNKHLLSTLGFHFPFFLTFCNNVGVWLVTYLVTRVPALRQEPVPFPTYLRLIVPMGLANMLDIGFSNWSLIL